MTARAPMPPARAVAHPNIAIAKYWGKLEDGSNLPAVPSLSITLDALSTTTTVGFGPSLTADRISIHGEQAPEGFAARIRAMLDRVREAAGLRMHAWVETANDFATASGLASSASGFAALALASTRAAGLNWDTSQLSDLARQSSASAARSLFGGWAALPAGQPGTNFLAAEQIAPQGHWDLVVLVCVTTRAPKAIGSTEGMKHTRATSPYYEAWVKHAPSIFERTRWAIEARDLTALGAAAEESFYAMHACAMAAAPALVYWNPTTLALLQRVGELRRDGLTAFATVDAGPHVKVLCTPADATAVEQALTQTAGLDKIIVARPGGPATVTTLGTRP